MNEISKQLDPRELAYGEFGDTATTVTAQQKKSNVFIYTPKLVKRNDRLKMYIPRGELEQLIREFIEELGIEMMPSNSYQQLAKNIPIEFLRERASAIPNKIIDPRYEANVGITGSDIIWQTAGMGKDTGEELPVYEVRPEAQQPFLYVGATPRLTEFSGSKPTIYDLEGRIVGTKYDKIAKEFFAEKQISVDIDQQDGGIEGMWLSSDTQGIIDIWQTGETAKNNGVELLEKICAVTIRLIDNIGTLTKFEADVLDEIRERVALAVEQRRMI